MSADSPQDHPTKGIRCGRYVFSPHWLPAIATVLISILLFNLGLWQLERAHYKEQVLERIQTRSGDTPHDLRSLLRLGADINDYPVRLHGYFLNDFNFLLDNRTHNREPGYEVITPFVSDQHLVLVNRGWIAQGPSRQQFPPIPAIDGEVTLEGTALVPNPGFFVLKEDDYHRVSWPFLIQKIDLEKSAALFDHRVAPFVLRLNPDENSGFVREWHSHFMGPEKHYGYAVQWFGLFTALWVIFFVVNTKRIRPVDKKK
jgi:surfeit locus 1 family protein